MRISDWSSDVCSSDLPDRIVVGTTSERAQEVMAQLYRPLYLNRSPLLFTARRTAELIQYAADAFLAVKIAFINEIADLCEQVGPNVQDVARGIGQIGGAHVRHSCHYCASRMRSSDGNKKHQ